LLFLQFDFMAAVWPLKPLLTRRREVRKAAQRTAKENGSGAAFISNRGLYPAVSCKENFSAFASLALLASLR
jgi:hypothetical protein